MVRKKVFITGSILILAFFVFSIGWVDKKADSINEGNTLLKEGSYEKAIALYDNIAVEYPDDILSRLNAGIGRYAASDYSGSLASFQDAAVKLSTSRQDEGKRDLIEKICSYGSGASEFQLGMAAKATDPAAAIQHMENAVENFGKAVRLDPSDNDSIYNYSLAYKVLEDLKDRQQDQQQNQEGADSQDQQNKSQNTDNQNQQENTEQGQENNRQDEQDRSQNQTNTDPNQENGQKNQNSDAGQNRQENGSDNQNSPGQNDQNNAEQQAAAMSTSAEKEDGQTMSKDEALSLLSKMEDQELHNIFVGDEQGSSPDGFPDW